MSRYATCDWHGYLGIYSEIKAFLQPDDIVYFLGDANDRGDHGYALMKLIYNDPQFKYLKGNHEQMFIDVARSWKNSGLTDEQCYKFNTSAYRMIKNNGGVLENEIYVENEIVQRYSKKCSNGAFLRLQEI